MSRKKISILLVNLGSPNSYKTSDVRSYLNEFLMDKYVIDVPYFIRAMIVKGFILPTRPKISGLAYKSIWTEKGSPLITHSHILREKLSNILNYDIYLAMRYGSPSIESVLQTINDQDVEELFVIPLYPQFAMSSTKTCIEKIKQINSNHFHKYKLHFLESFYNDEGFINSLSNSIKPYLKNNYDKILFSYHGLPERQLTKVDPTNKHCGKVKNCCIIPSEAHKYCYKHQCYDTTSNVISKLNIEPNQYDVGFQSRLGNTPWIKPFTDTILMEYAKTGIKNIAVVCPSFVSDCLETLEEVGIRFKEMFLKAGGENLELIPCLNDSSEWVNALADLSNKFVDSKNIPTEA